MDRLARRRVKRLCRQGRSRPGFAADLACSCSAWILFTLIERGAPALGANVFTKVMLPPGENGGLLNAIVGSLIQIGAGARSSARRSASWPAPISPRPGAAASFAGAVRFVNDILLSAPSILIGLFVYQLLVVHHRRLLRLGRHGRARHHHPAGRGAHHRGHAGAGADRPARGRLRARRAAMEGHHLRHLARRAGRHRHRHPARSGAGRRRDGTAALHLARQQRLVARSVAADGRACRSPSTNMPAAPSTTGWRWPGPAPC